VHHADKLAHDWKTSYLLLALDKEVFAELIGGPACVDPGPLACPRKLAIVISQKKKTRRQQGCCLRIELD
jgi:hypothetical protein